MAIAPSHNHHRQIIRQARSSSRRISSRRKRGVEVDAIARSARHQRQGSRRHAPPSSAADTCAGDTPHEIQRRFAHICGVVPMSRTTPTISSHPSAPMVRDRVAHAPANRARAVHESPREGFVDDHRSRLPGDRSHQRSRDQRRSDDRTRRSNVGPTAAVQRSGNEELVQVFRLASTSPRAVPRRTCRADGRANVTALTPGSCAIRRSSRRRSVRDAPRTPRCLFAGGAVVPDPN